MTTKGLYHKYNVFDAETGEPVTGAFVLLPETDPIAQEALDCYAEATGNLTLQADLYEWLDDIREAQGKERLG